MKYLTFILQVLKEFIDINSWKLFRNYLWLKTYEKKNFQLIFKRIVEVFSNEFNL